MSPFFSSQLTTLHIPHDDGSCRHLIIDVDSRCKLTHHSTAAQLDASEPHQKIGIWGLHRTHCNPVLYLLRHPSAASDGSFMLSTAQVCETRYQQCTLHRLLSPIHLQLSLGCPGKKSTALKEALLSWLAITRLELITTRTATINIQSSNSIESVTTQAILTTSYLILLSPSNEPQRHPHHHDHLAIKSKGWESPDRAAGSSRY